MSKGGVDTGGMEAQAAQLTKLGQEQLKLAKDIYGEGSQYFGGYVLPIFNEYMRILGFPAPSATASAVGGTQVPSTGYAASNMTAGGVLSGAPSYSSYGYQLGPSGALTNTWTPQGQGPPSSTPQLVGMADRNTAIFDVGGQLFYAPYSGGGDLYDVFTRYQSGFPGVYNMGAQTGGGGEGAGSPAGRTLAPNWYQPYFGGRVESMQPYMGGTEGVTWAQGYTPPGTAQPTQPQYGGYGTAFGTGAYVSPLQSHLYQYPVYATGQQYDALRKQIEDMGLGPGATSAMLAQAAQQRLQGLGATAFQQVAGMLDQIVNTMSQQRASSIGGAGSFMGGAAGSMSAAGQMYSNIAQLQAQAAQQQGGGLLGGLYSAATFASNFIPGIGPGVSSIMGLFNPWGGIQTGNLGSLLSLGNLSGLGNLFGGGSTQYSFGGGYPGGWSGLPGGTLGPSY